MRYPLLRLSLCAAASLLPQIAQGAVAPAAQAPARQDHDDDGDGDQDAGKGSAKNSDDSAIVVTARKLDDARDSIQPAIGASEYRLTADALAIQPGGPTRALNSVLLQAPGVTQDTDGDGEIHIRNEHGNIQYRLNGVTIPDSISGFGPLVDTEVAQSVDLLTGALPAQYGYRTAGVVQLKTYTGSFEPDGHIGLYGGAHGTVQPTASWRDSAGRLNYFVSASYLRSNLGIASPTPDFTVLHDKTEQLRAFAYLSYLIDDASRISLFGGTSIGTFQIPNTPGLAPSYHVNGQSTYDSAALNQNQRQQTHYAVLSYQYSGAGLDAQVSPFARWARARFLPDANGGELFFNGTDSQLTQTNLAYGLQGDASWKASDHHTIRFGLFLQREQSQTDSINRVFCVDPACNQANGIPFVVLSNQTGDVPIVVPVDQRATADTIGFYLQDEWKLSDTLTFNYGLRYDRFHWNLTEDQLSPRAGLVWKPHEGTTVHLGYARNFTPPPLAQIGVGALAAFAGTTAAAEVTTADPVRSEREHLFDAGVQQVVAKHLTLGFDAYYKLKRNLLDDTQFGTTELLAPFNYADGYAWGVELTASYERGPVSAYLNVARGEEKGKTIVSNQFFFSQKELDYIAQHTIYTDHSQKWTISAGGALKLDNALGQFQPSVELIYGSGLRREDESIVDANGDPIPNGGTQSPYVQVNLGVAQVFGKNKENGLTVRLDVTNLFDRTYVVHDGSGVGAGQKQYGPRRAIMAGIRKNF